MIPHKVVAKYKQEDMQKSWSKGKPLNQAKKRVYISEEDYNRYSPNLIKRWSRGYYIEVSQYIDGKWVIRPHL